MNTRHKRIYDRAPSWAQSVALTLFSLTLDRQRYGGDYSRQRAFLSESESYDEGRLREYQDAQLRRLVQHAYDTVPYYRRAFDEHGIDPRAIRESGDLRRLPLLTKEDIKQNFAALHSTAVPRHQLTYGHTSGTTGTPLEVAYDPSLVTMTYAVLDRQYRWAGVSMRAFGDRVAIARGNVIVPVERRTPPFWRTNYYHNQLYLSSFHMSPANLPHYITAVRRFGAKVLDGYPSTLYVLAKHLKNRGEVLPLQAVLSSSETLYDFQREVIEESFACRVFDYYGAAERVAFATECDRHEGHHLNSEFGIAEILDEQSKPVDLAVEGRLVGTSLHNYAMPLIRYVTNDVTALRPRLCSCGRALPLMEDVLTKAEDILTLPDGRLMSPSVLTHPFKPMHTVEASQIVQEDLGHICIKVVPASGYSPSDSEYLLREFRARLGEQVTIEVQLVNGLPRAASGKFKWVISNVELGV